MNDLSKFEQATIQVDAKQLKCPMPLLKLKQALNAISLEQSVHLIATDRTSLRDIKSFIDVSKHSMTTSDQETEIHFYVVKG